MVCMSNWRLCSEWRYVNTDKGGKTNKDQIARPYSSTTRIYHLWISIAQAHSWDREAQAFSTKSKFDWIVNVHLNKTQLTSTQRYLVKFLKFDRGGADNRYVSLWRISPGQLCLTTHLGSEYLAVKDLPSATPPLVACCLQLGKVRWSNLTTGNRHEADPLNSKKKLMVKLEPAGGVEVIRMMSNVSTTFGYTDESPEVATGECHIEYSSRMQTEGTSISNAITTQ